jgi:hypothetical protein
MKIESIAQAAENVDELVPPAGELGNQVLIDDHRLIRLAGPMFTLLSILMIPWTVFIALVLPSRQVSTHYDLAWTGFDGMLLVALAGTAYFALRRSHYLSLAASSAGTLLIVDAWFDVLTSRSADRLLTIVFAAIIELPLAASCWWLSQQTQVIAEKRLTLLLPRGGGRLRRNAMKSKGYSTW